MVESIISGGTREGGFNTAADVAYNVVREKILSGDFQPGQKLSRRKMARLTGVSVIPVIEAMHKLEQDGLVESMPHWGTRVVELSEKRIRDYFALREAVECQIVRMLAGKLDALQIHILEGLADNIDSRNNVPDTREYTAFHYQFHLKLAEFSGCDLLTEALNRTNLFLLLKKAMEKRRTFPKSLPADWHSRIVTAIKNGDPDEAEKMMRLHVLDSLRT